MSSRLATILLVEDDLPLQRSIGKILQSAGHTVVAASRLAQAFQEIRRAIPGLIILDRQLPDGEGLELIKHLRAEPEGASVGVLVISGKDATLDKVTGLSLGSDDYLTKPFEADELLARVQALLRRTHPTTSSLEPSAVLELQGIRMDFQAHECSIDAKPIQLWPKEWELLRLFLERPGRVLNKTFLSERIWEHEFFGTSRHIEMAVQRLRRKLGPKGRLIETVKGYGYRLRAS